MVLLFSVAQSRFAQASAGFAKQVGESWPAAAAASTRTAAARMARGVVGLGVWAARQHDERCRQGRPGTSAMGSL